MALALPAAAQENSALDQLTRREQLLGWEAVGRIDIEGGGFCTGTLIATNLVLTAGHCVFEKDGTPVAVSRIRFRAGLVNGRAIAEMKVARTVADPAYLPTAPGTPATVRHDVALLELEGDIPAAIAAPFVVATPGTDDTVSVVSYAAGREEALSWQKTCQVLGQENGLIAVDCDVSFGSSARRAGPLVRR
ncbi:MAG: trypsin-like serine protease [Sphingomonadales bacterium]|nr:trypsin-like serine protease [Sphingomonadales bacterium]